MPVIIPLKDTIADSIRNAYGLDPDELRYVSGFENLIFEFSRRGESFIVRAGAHQPHEQVLAEVEWVRCLEENGVGVSGPVASANGRLVKTVWAGGAEVSIAAFRKARGRFIGSEASDERFWEALGSVIGRIHALSMGYSPEHRRNQFEADRFLRTEGILDPVGEKDVAGEYLKLQEWLLTLPKEKGAYGMVHGDLNWGNYFVDEAGDITLFDFDSCCYNWFAYDIAIAIYSLIWEFDSDETVQTLNRLVPAFMRGYNRHHRLPAEWFGMMPRFLMFHDYYLYTAIKETIVAGNKTEDYPSMLEVIRTRCESGLSLNLFSPDEWVKLFNDAR